MVLGAGKAREAKDCTAAEHGMKCAPRTQRCVHQDTKTNQEEIGLPPAHLFVHVPLSVSFSQPISVRMLLIPVPVCATPKEYKQAVSTTRKD